MVKFDGDYLLEIVNKYNRFFLVAATSDAVAYLRRSGLHCCAPLAVDVELHLVRRNLQHPCSRTFMADAVEFCRGRSGTPATVLPAPENLDRSRWRIAALAAAISSPNYYCCDCADFASGA